MDDVVHKNKTERTGLIANKSLRIVIVVAILLVSSIPAALYGASMLGDHSLNSKTPSPITQPPFNGMARLGIDCGYNTNEAVANATGYPGPDGAASTGNANNPTLDTSCTWAGAPDGSGQLMPLVSDNPVLAPGPSCCAAPSRGGGFTADVVFIQNSTTVVSSFDITVRWDPKILNAVEFDQGGLPWFGGNSFTAQSVIDNTAGTAELAQALQVPPAPTAFLTGNQTLFRLRFDVVGIGSTSLSLFNDQVIDPNLVPNGIHHITVANTFTSSNIPDLIAGVTLSYTVTWSFSPTPEVPGSPLTLVAATATCTGCTGMLAYSWDTDSVQGYPASGFTQTIEATGQSAVITAPTATLLAHRVTLIVNDTAGHVAEATRRLPLALTAPASQTVAINTAASFTAKWLGGIPPYSGTTGQVGLKWILCNSTGSTQTICTNPNPSAGSPPNQLNGQTNTVSNMYKWAGVFTGTVTVTDTAEAPLPGPNTISASFQVNVTGSPQAFTVNVTTSAAFSGSVVGTTANFTAAVAYATGYSPLARSSLFNYTFIFGDGTSASIQSNRLVASKIHTFASTPTIPAIVVVQELSSNSLAKIKETGFLIPLGSFSISPSSPTIGQTLSFSATPTGGQPPYTYDWDFGDGTKTTGASVTHSYSTAGNYTVTMTITDYWGHKFTSTQTVTVTSGSTTNSNTFYEEIGGGIAAAVAAIAALMLIRRRRRAAASAIGGTTGPVSR